LLPPFERRDPASLTSIDGAPIPIFVISFNRGAMLKLVVDSYLRLSNDVEVIVHDNGSDDPATLDCLEELRGAGIEVVNAPKIHSQIELNAVSETVRAHFGGPPSSRYVVSDCDIDMSIAAPDALALYSELLDQFPDAECVGPMLRIRDIPREYPLFNRVMNRHIEAFWGLSPEWTQTTLGPIAILPAPFDTTFALHREGEEFRRRKRGLRVYHPYEARHLDWYLGAGAPAPDTYERTSSQDISHWNNRVQRELHADAQLRFQRLLYVAEGEDGKPCVRELEL
jgi:hypothetical protein